MPHSVPPPSSSALADWLEDAILSGTLAPGSRVDLVTLADQRGVGWPQIREAVLHLAADGLASLESDGTTLRISPVSLADLKDLTSTRIVVEAEALRQSIMAGDAAWEERVHVTFSALAAVEPLFPDSPPELVCEWEHRNAAFHAALDAACPLQRLTAFNKRLYKQHQRYRHLALLGRRDNPRDVQAEHIALYHAAMSRDGNRAADILTRHIALTEQDVAATIRMGSWFGVANPPE